MDISQLRTSRAMALHQRTACTFITGLGYVRLGEQRMPDEVVFPPSACLPPADTPHGTLFGFIPPGASTASVRLVWLADVLLWQPVSPLAGNRLAFRPAYLAAHGRRLDQG